jgi:hypothetical protein
MTAPLDPRHARPIDVHRWSDHHEVRELVNQIWNDHFGAFHEPEKPRPGPKPKTRHKDMLKVLLLDLYVAWKTDPDLSIGIHLSNSEWKTTSRYNALHLSKVIVEYVHHLDYLGLIELSKGSYTAPSAATNRTSRIRASEPLRKLFREARFGLKEVGRTERQECIIMRKDDGEGGVSKPVEYSDTEHTVKLRSRLRRYNDLLSHSFIDIPFLDEPFVERSVNSGPRAGQKVKLPIGAGNQFVRRVFSRGDWALNGRFYGGWWQQIDSNLRKRIHVNDVPTVEVDFKGLHVNLLSVLAGAGKIEGDPYDLTEGFLEGVEQRQQRKYLKYLVLAAINAKDKNSAFRAFRDHYPKGDPGKTFTNTSLQHLLDEFLARTPQLREGLFADQGIRLMKLDSDIAALVISHFTDLGIPVLCIHDSFVIDYRCGAALKKVMRRASSQIVGEELDLSHNYLGLGEVPESRREDYKELRRLDRAPGYLERKRWFEERKYDERQKVELG